MRNPLQYLLYIFAGYQAVIAAQPSSQSNQPNTYLQNQAELDNCFELPSISAQSDCLLEFSNQLPLGNQLAFTQKLMAKFSAEPEISHKFRQRFSELMNLKPMVESLIDLNSTLPHQYKTQEENLDKTTDKIKLRARLLFGLCKQLYEKQDYQAMKYTAEHVYSFLRTHNFSEQNPETKSYIKQAHNIFQCAQEAPLEIGLSCQQAFFNKINNNGIMLNISSKHNDTTQAQRSM